MGNNFSPLYKQLQEFPSSHQDCRDGLKFRARSEEGNKSAHHPPASPALRRKLGFTPGLCDAELGSKKFGAAVLPFRP